MNPIHQELARITTIANALGCLTPNLAYQLKINLTANAHLCKRLKNMDDIHRDLGVLWDQIQHDFPDIPTKDMKQLAAYLKYIEDQAWMQIKFENMMRAAQIVGDKQWQEELSKQMKMYKKAREQ